MSQRTIPNSFLKWLRFSKFATRTLDVDSEKLDSIEFVELDGQSVGFEVDEENSQGHSSRSTTIFRRGSSHRGFL